MGAVWAAKHLRLPGKRVAIKVLHGRRRTIARSFARFRREAEIASRIGHPNIVDGARLQRAADGTPYLVLEYLEGEDLAQRLDARARFRCRRRWPSRGRSARRCTRRTGPTSCTAISSRTTSSWSATEIGGELVDQVKVLDFGISKIRGSQTVKTQDSVLLGTPQYMAPEQALGKNTEIDERTDVFALGAIVYEMLAGRPAFLGDDAGRGGVQGRLRQAAAAGRSWRRSCRRTSSTPSSRRWRRIPTRASPTWARSSTRSPGGRCRRSIAPGEEAGAGGVRVDDGGGSPSQPAGRGDDGRARRGGAGDSADDGGRCRRRQERQAARRSSFVGAWWSAVIGGDVGVMKMTAEAAGRAAAGSGDQVATTAAPPKVETPPPRGADGREAAVTAAADAASTVASRRSSCSRRDQADGADAQRRSRCRPRSSPSSTRRRRRSTATRAKRCVRRATRCRRRSRAAPFPSSRAASASRAISATPRRRCTRSAAAIARASSSTARRRNRPAVRALALVPLLLLPSLACGAAGGALQRAAVAACRARRWPRASTSWSRAWPRRSGAPSRGPTRASTRRRRSIGALVPASGAAAERAGARGACGLHGIVEPPPH